MRCSAEARDWAKLVKVCYGLAGGSPFESPPPNPGANVADLFHAMFRPTTPVEVYSDHRPTYSPPSNRDDLVPIDVLLGCYNPSERKIEIFIKNVEHYARTVFRCDLVDLARIVRLHEHAHAFVHVGIYCKDDTTRMNDYPAGGSTDWKPFQLVRDRLFSALDETTHEYLAQLITWLALSAEGTTGGPPISELFSQLLQRQPPANRIDQAILDSVTLGNFGVVLQWLWNATRTAPPSGVSLAEAVVALSLPIPE